MPKLIDKPAVIEAAGNKPKRIEEFVGKVKIIKKERVPNNFTVNHLRKKKDERKRN